MPEYDFTLKFEIKAIPLTPDDCADHLYGNGCDDTLIGIGTPGYIALNFLREAPTALEAVTSAIADVRQTLPHAPLVEASPDLGGVSDIASLMNCSRQNARKLTTLNAECPPPIHGGKTPLWHMADVLQHLSATRRCEVQPEAIELTSVVKLVNLQNSYRRSGTWPQGLSTDPKTVLNKISELVNV